MRLILFLNTSHNAAHSVTDTGSLSSYLGSPLKAAVVTTDNDSHLKSSGQLEPPQSEGLKRPLSHFLTGRGSKYPLSWLQKGNSSLLPSYWLRLVLVIPELNSFLSSLLFLFFLILILLILGFFYRPSTVVSIFPYHFPSQLSPLPTLDPTPL